MMLISAIRRQPAADFLRSGPLASVLIAHRPKRPSQRQDGGRKRGKLEGIRG
jgi:hypothetical protein